MVRDNVTLERSLDFLKIFQLVFVELVLSHDRNAVVRQVILDAGGNVGAMDMVRVQASHLSVWSGAVLGFLAHLCLPQVPLDCAERYRPSVDEAVIYREFQGVFHRAYHPFIFPPGYPENRSHSFKLIIIKSALPFIRSDFAPT
ncbi:MAG: hypothetical protein ACD_75C01374G0006 [uncultured bacterium]|nr:MAG: hypothetical protein ACD_75C01374G0006 [uncultured bacterium]